MAAPSTGGVAAQPGTNGQSGRCGSAALSVQLRSASVAIGRWRGVDLDPNGHHRYLLPRVISAESPPDPKLIPAGGLNWKAKHSTHRAKSLYFAESDFVFGLSHLVAACCTS